MRLFGSTATGTIRVNNNWWDKTSTTAIAATITNTAPITINTTGFLSVIPVEIDSALGNDPRQLQAISIEYYHDDGFNSPNVATNATGAVLWQEHYQPFGESRLNQDPNPSINYTGHALDRDTGLIYAGARYMDPVIGRFMSIDPVEFTETNPVSFNRYAYANNSPYAFYDPDGNNPLLIAGAGIAIEETIAAIAAIGGSILFKEGMDALFGLDKERNFVFSDSNDSNVSTSQSGVGPQTGGASPDPDDPNAKKSKVKKEVKTEKIGDKFTKTTKIFPGKGPGQSRSEMEFIKNQDGKLIRSRKFSYDRADKFQHNKPARGGPEGRGANEN